MLETQYILTSKTFKYPFQISIDLAADLFQFIAKANQKSEWMWSAYFKIIMGGVFVVKIVLSSFSAVICWMQYKEFNSKCVYRPYKMV